MGGREPGHQGGRHDLIPRTANRSHSRRQIERQDFISGDMGEVQNVYEMDMRVNEPRQEIFTAPIDARGARGYTGHLISARDLHDPLPAYNNGSVGQHSAGY
jgi:hypothetical protein